MSHENEQEQNKQDEQQEQELQLPKRKRYKRSLKSEIVDVEDDNGHVTEYEIREMTQSEKEEWQSSMKSRYAMTKDGKSVKLENHKRYCAELLSRCMRDRTTGKKLMMGTFDNWSTTTVEGLWADCARINGLDKTETQAEEEAKKD